MRNFMKVVSLVLGLVILIGCGGEGSAEPEVAAPTLAPTSTSVLATAEPTAEPTAPPTATTETAPENTPTPEVQVEDSERQVDFNTPFEMKISDTVQVAQSGQVLVVLSIEDTRCPKDVACFWAGEVKVWLSVDGEEVMLLISGHDVEGVSAEIFPSAILKLESVLPYPVSTAPTEPQDMAITFTLLSQ